MTAAAATALRGAERDWGVYVSSKFVMVCVSPASFMMLIFVIVQFTVSLA